MRAATPAVVFFSNRNHYANTLKFVASLFELGNHLFFINFVITYIIFFRFLKSRIQNSLGTTKLLITKKTNKDLLTYLKKFYANTLRRSTQKMENQYNNKCVRRPETKLKNILKYYLRYNVVVLTMQTWSRSPLTLCRRSSPKKKHKKKQILVVEELLNLYIDCVRSLCTLFSKKFSRKL